EFFIQPCKQIIDQRKRDPDGAKRNDLVQLMMDSFVYEHELTDSNYDKLTASIEDTDGKTDGKMDDETDGMIQINHFLLLSEKSNYTGKRSAPDSRSKQLKRLTENEIIAQCFLFFVA